MKHLLKNKIKIWLTFLLGIAIIIPTSCKKGWLEAKPDKSLSVPKTLSDFQALLDNIAVMNLEPALGECGSDNHYIQPQTLATQSQLTNTTYKWAANGWEGSSNVVDWSAPYTAIYYANLSIDGLGKIVKTPDNEQTWNALYGSSLFYRAYAYFHLAQVFCKPYDKNTSNSDLGLPISLQANINQKLPRSTVQQTYDQILSDLFSSRGFLPNSTSYKNRPTKTVLYAMLARTYLAMEEYDKALIYADSSLQKQSTLIDYNSLQTTTPPALPANSFPSSFDQNQEIIFYSVLVNASNLSQSNATVDSTLYQSYSINDLRRIVFFRTSGGRVVWAGNYRGVSTGNQFNGLAVDEMYLTRAECHARKGNTAGAMSDLNALMIKRWRSSAWVAFTAIDANDALKKILTERRKELLFRGLRWPDLRRLNRDPQFAKTITRFADNQTYMLLPNENKYVWPIPNSEVLYNGIEQNPR
jgi:tetratricopeptide (TPR) repeat protein